MTKGKDLRALIAKGLDGDSRYTVDDVVDGLAEGYFQCFEEGQGIVITKFTGYRDKRLLVFLLAGENFDEWKERITKRLALFAKENGCSCIEAYCRPGLKKALKGLGWESAQIVMRLHLKEKQKYGI